VKELLRLEGEGLLGFVALSPEGTEVAFTQWQHEHPATEREQPKSISLMTKPVSEGQAAELLTVKFPELISNLGWSNDGRYLIFGKVQLRRTVSPQQSWELWRIEPQVGSPERIGVLENLVVREPIRLHPEDSRIVFTRADKRAEIWTMEGLLAKDSTSN
jgi:hypothetical protein